MSYCYCYWYFDEPFLIEPLHSICWAMGTPAKAVTSKLHFVAIQPTTPASKLADFCSDANIWRATQLCVSVATIYSLFSHAIVYGSTKTFAKFIASHLLHWHYTILQVVAILTPSSLKMANFRSDANVWRATQLCVSVIFWAPPPSIVLKCNYVPEVGAPSARAHL